MPKAIDLTNQTFGNLTVIKKSEKKASNGHLMWECKCSCGNEKIITVQGSHLRSGHTQSCGCLQKKFAREMNFVDIAGQQFGGLTAIKNIGSSEKGQAIWQCKCKCGNIIEVVGSDLRNGHTQSCGCVRSVGETKIIKILTENNIKFTTQKTFTNCVFSNSKGLARFDFWVENKYLIEYDGIQHFDPYQQFGKNLESFQLSQQRDEYKNQWCKENSIPLIRIPYTIYDNLNLQDLQLETTKYRVV